MSVIPANGTCPMDRSRLQCDSDCQLWINEEWIGHESCCAIRSIAYSLWQLTVSLAEIERIFKKAT